MNLKEIFEDKEYMQIAEIYLNDEYVQSLKNIPHHDSNRLDHSLKVSYNSYKLSKMLNLNTQSVVKAGLLHDLYFNRIEECNSIKDKVLLFMNEHPEDALKNARDRFYITPMEKDIILSHMWPASKHFPKYKESLIVSLVDKSFSFVEVGTKWNYSLSFMTGVYFIFIMYSLFK